MEQELKNDLIATKWEVDNCLEQLKINDSKTLEVLTERLTNAKAWLDKHIGDDEEIKELK